jgi:hypothetical protein
MQHIGFKSLHLAFLFPVSIPKFAQRKKSKMGTLMIGWSLTSTEGCVISFLKHADDFQRKMYVKGKI